MIVIRRLVQKNPVISQENISAAQSGTIFQKERPAFLRNRHGLLQDYCDCLGFNREGPPPKQERIDDDPALFQANQPAAHEIAPAEKHSLPAKTQSLRVPRS
ncbi:MAG TPA: hypothetical protein DIV54_10675, partial [Verrucomicrobiales bacterium]|nr:hypothetical protein [Verrucomicrobiales bacterium]